MQALNVLALILLVIGGINWGLVGLFQFDLVAALFGGGQTTLSRIVYVLVGLAALYGIALLGPLSGSTTSDFRSRYTTKNNP